LGKVHFSRAATKERRREPQNTQSGKAATKQFDQEVTAENC
jgi:hypothetical protein